METIIRQFAQYRIHQLTADNWTVSYTLIKDGQPWGTFYHIQKSSSIFWVGSSGHFSYPNREKIIDLINANEARLERKANK